MTTPQEIIQQQQELIEQYKAVVDAHTDAQQKLYNYINELHKLLVTKDPKSMQMAIEYIGKLAEKAKQ